MTLGKQISARARWKLTTLLTATVLVIGEPASADLIVNGGFETGDFAGWSLTGDISFTGVDTVAPHSGFFAAFSGSFQGAVLEQTVVTIPGSDYTIDFWLQNEADPSGVAVPNDFEFDWGGTPVLTLIDQPAMGYTHFSFLLQATTPTTDVRFLFRQLPAFWDFDDVSATAQIPEPATLALLGIGLAGLGFSRHRKSN